MPYGIQYRANISYMESLDEKGHMRNVMIYGKTDRRCDIQTVYVVAEVLGGKAGWRGRRARQGTGEGMRAGRNYQVQPLAGRRGSVNANNHIQRGCCVAIAAERGPR